jgi:hypothetical protein
MVRGQVVARDIEIGEIRDSIVLESTQKSYIAEIFNLMIWLRHNAPNVLKEAAEKLFSEFEAKAGGVSNIPTSKLYTMNKKEFIIAVRECDVRPLIIENNLTVEVYVDYARTLRKKNKPMEMLGKGAYGVRRAALFHLFRCHNGNGYSHTYGTRMTNMFRGLYRVLVNRRRDRERVTAALTEAAADTGTVATEGAVNVPSKKDATLNIANFGK